MIDSPPNFLPKVFLLSLLASTSLFAAVVHSEASQLVNFLDNLCIRNLQRLPSFPSPPECTLYENNITKKKLLVVLLARCFGRPSASASAQTF